MLSQARKTGHAAPDDADGQAFKVWASATGVSRWRAGPVDSRTLRVQGSSTRSKSFASTPLRRRINSRQAAEAKSSTGWATVVRVRLEREHPVEVVEADDRDVAGDFEIEPARGLDRGQRADIGEGEDRRRPVGAMKLEFDCAAQRFEVMAAVDDALAPLEPRLGQGAPGAGDAKLDILEPFRMGENGDVAVTEADEMASRGVAAGVAIGAHGVESEARRPRGRSAPPAAGGRRRLRP